MQQAYRDLEEQNLRLRRQIDQLTDALNTKERFINTQKVANQNNLTVQNNLRNKICKLEERIKRLEFSLTNQKEKTQNLKNALENGNHPFQKTQQEHKNKISQPYELIASDHQSLRKYSEDYELRKQFQGLKEELRQKNNEINELANYKKNHLQQIRNLQQQLKELQQKQCREPTEKNLSSQNGTSFQNSRNNVSMDFDLPLQIEEISKISGQKTNLNVQNQKAFYKLQAQNQPQHQNIISEEIQKHNLQQRNQELEEQIAQLNKKNQLLAHQLFTMEQEYASSQKKQSYLLNEPLQFNKQHLIQSRKMEFGGQDHENMHNFSKSSLKAIIMTISNHYNSILQSRRITFLNTLIFWAQQRLQTTYKSIQDLA